MFEEVQDFFNFEYYSPLISAGIRGGPFAGCRGEVITGFNKLQWKTGWMCLRVLANSNCTVTGLMVLIMGKRSNVFWSKFLERLSGL